MVSRNPMNERAGYATLRERFRWRLPQQLNMATVCCDRHDREATALIQVDRGGETWSYTFGDLSDLSSRFANALRAKGVRSGDRVAIVLPQGIEAGVALLATFRLGAIAVPLSGLFGVDGLRPRLGNAGARVVITDNDHLEPIRTVTDEIGQVNLIVTDGGVAPDLDFWDLVKDGSPFCPAAATEPDTPAFLIFTSGTTGNPKGALQGHRSIIGHLPGFQLSHDFFPEPGDRFWTPADWAWIGGLMDALLPTWYYGCPVVAAPREKFDPEWAVRLIREQNIRNCFLPPTVLKIMRQGLTAPADVDLRSVMCGGEALGAEMLSWAEANLGVTVNEIYGQTEANYVIGNCASAWEQRPGSMGRPYPGHDVAVLADGESLAPSGTVGQLAVRAPDPVMFLRYWDNPDATAAKFTASGEWLLTGDMASRDEDGYLWFYGRDDDVINSAGYRIGPSEIESCLMRHHAVEMAAAVGVPDEIRGEAVKAYVVTRVDDPARAELEGELRDLVRNSLAAYLYPRHFEFVSELPLTATGKIRRAELRRAEQERHRQAQPAS